MKAVPQLAQSNCFTWVNERSQYRGGALLGVWRNREVISVLKKIKKKLERVACPVTNPFPALRGSAPGEQQHRCVPPSCVLWQMESSRWQKRDNTCLRRPRKPLFPPRRAKPGRKSPQRARFNPRPALPAGPGLEPAAASSHRPRGPPLGARRVRLTKALWQYAARPEAEVAAQALPPLPSAGRRRGPAAAAASRRYERGRVGVCHAAGPRSAWGSRHRHAPRSRVLRGGGVGERRGGGRRAERSGPRLR